ncbi:MAG: YcnI family protein [Acidimicrobiales bacterium]
MRIVRLTAGFWLAVAVGIACFTPAAGAHVTADKDEVAAGGFDAVTLTVPHGCEESPTIRLAVQIPDGFMSVSPQVKPGWEITTEIEALDPPVDDGHGGQITERVAVVTFTGGPLPVGFRDTFTIGFQAPDTPGELAYFKTVQTCEQGETAWIDEWDGEGEEPEHPAPALMLVAAEDDGHAADADDVAAATGEQAAAPDAAGTDDGPSTGLVVAALVMGAAGLVLGGTSLVMAQRRA